MPSSPGADFEEHFFNVFFTRAGVIGESSKSSVIVGEGTQSSTQDGKVEYCVLDSEKSLKSRHMLQS